MLWSYRGAASFAKEALIQSRIEDHRSTVSSDVGDRQGGVAHLFSASLRLGACVTVELTLFNRLTDANQSVRRVLAAGR